MAVHVLFMAIAGDLRLTERV